MLNKLKEFVLSILIWLDEGLNTLVIGIIGLFITIPVPAEGNAHYTVSAVLAELRNDTASRAAHNVGCIGCKILTFIFGINKPKNYDHCVSALQGMPLSIPSGT